MSFFPHLVDWTRDLDSAEGSFLHNMVDFTRVGVAGHSRGGKLAAYQAASMDSLSNSSLEFDLDLKPVESSVDVKNLTGGYFHWVANVCQCCCR